MLSIDMPVEPRRSRWLPSALHLGVSAGVALLAALLVFGWWFPNGLGPLAGGSDLFWLLTCVDVVLGPALTFVIASPLKPRRELARDIAIIASIQAVALVYGLSAIDAARPAAIVWEVDQFRLVSRAALDQEALSQAPPGLGTLSWAGPIYRTAVKPKNAAEQLRAVELALAGVPLAALPRHWAAEEAARAGIEQTARPLTSVRQMNPTLEPVLASIARAAQVSPEALRGVPIHGRHGYWIAVMAPGSSRPSGFLPIDPDAAPAKPAEPRQRAP